MKQEEINMIKNIWLNNLSNVCDEQLKLMKNEYENKVKKCVRDFDILKDSSNTLKLADELLFELLGQVYCNFKSISVTPEKEGNIKMISNCIDLHEHNNKINLEKDKNYTIVLMAIEKDDDDEKE